MMILLSLPQAISRWQWLATSLLLTAGSLGGASLAPPARAQAVDHLKSKSCQPYSAPVHLLKHLAQHCDRALAASEPPLTAAAPLLNEPFDEPNFDIGARLAPDSSLVVPTADSTAAAPSMMTAGSPLPLVAAEDPPPSDEQTVDVDPAIIESSPVLQRWLEEVPDVAIDIQHDPAFRTRVRLGYAEFPSADNTGGVYVGVQDLFVGRTPLTLSAEYAINGRGDRQLIGADAQYYLLPLGWYGNVAPVVGYRSIDTSAFDSDGINLGFRIILVPSRGGAADLSFTQSWVAPGTDQEVGLSTFSAGYAIAEDIRIGTDIQTQNTGDRQESRVTLLLEWMP